MGRLSCNILDDVDGSDNYNSPYEGKEVGEYEKEMCP